MFSQPYGAEGGGEGRYFDFVACLNLLMALGATLVGHVALRIGGGAAPPLDKEEAEADASAYRHMAASNTLASPCGYAALRFVPFPVLLVGKAAKLVPIVAARSLLYGMNCKKHEYIAVALITTGVLA